jgi:hypothetical protein
MKRLTILFIGLCSVVLSESTAQQQLDSLWRGVYLFGNQRVNYRQMRDSLHLNAFQIALGYDTSAENASVFSTSQTMRVINLRMKFADPASFPDARASAQQMEYQAEQGVDPLKNYFTYRPVGTTSQEGDARLAELGVDTIPGYMVTTAAPNNEYHYNRNHYLATFRVKVDAPYSAGDTVVQCIVKCANNPTGFADTILFGSDFDSAGVYREFTLPFNISFPLSSQEVLSSAHVLTNGALGSGTSHGQVDASCGGVDLQVYWYGHVTTYLDKVTVQDSVALRLFSGAYDQEIKQEAALYGNKGQHERFYLLDEPSISAFQAFEYDLTPCDVPVRSLSFVEH